MISVTGLVARPLTITLKDLERLPHTSLTVRVVDPDGRHRVHFFTGVALRDLLALAKPQTAGGVDNSTRGFVTVSGVNGDSAIVSLPEIEPNFNGKQVLVAYLIDARLLQSQGMAELVVPEDATRGRFITGITRILLSETAP